MNIRPLWTLALACLTLSVTGLHSCQEREQTTQCFPYSNIRVELPLDLPAYQPLRNVGGWIYVQDQGSGTRGLIVVRTSSGFLAFDRNAPHLCPSDKTTLEVQNDIKIVCPADGAEWILLTGEPVKGTGNSPKRYLNSLNAAGNVLSIYNQ